MLTEETVEWLNTSKKEKAGETQNSTRPQFGLRTYHSEPFGFAQDKLREEFSV